MHLHIRPFSNGHRPRFSMPRRLFSTGRRLFSSNRSCRSFSGRKPFSNGRRLFFTSHSRQFSTNHKPFTPQEKVEEWKMKVATFFVDIEPDDNLRKYFKSIKFFKKIDQFPMIHTSWVVGVAKHWQQHNDDDIFFMSTPDNKGGHHAEELILKRLGISGIESINLSHSPCSSCTVLLLVSFWSQPQKPTINFLCIHGTIGTPDRQHSLRNLKLLLLNGFTLGVWDCSYYKECLLEDSPSKYDRVLIQKKFIDHELKMEIRATKLTMILHDLVEETTCIMKANQMIISQPLSSCDISPPPRVHGDYDTTSFFTTLSFGYGIVFLLLFFLACFVYRRRK